METRTLGNSDLQITPIGFGAWAIGGGDWVGGWGDQDDAESIDAIRAGLDAGMNWIDTAAAYGFGHSEEVVRRALEGVSQSPLVFTKCGLLPKGGGMIRNDLSTASIIEQVDDSLRRLGVDSIDLMQIHWPDPDPDVEEAWGELLRQRDAGKIRYLGVSNFNVEQLERISLQEPPTSLQPPYHLIDRHVEESLLPYCAEHNIGVIVYSPMASGLLTGKMTRERIEKLPENDWRSRSANFKEPKLTENLALVDRLREVGDAHGVAPGNVAVAWTLRRPEVTGAIVGFRRPDQVQDFAKGMELRLSEDEIARIG